jgi:hypothetical protein
MQKGRKEVAIFIPLRPRLLAASLEPLPTGLAVFPAAWGIRKTDLTPRRKERQETQKQRACRVPARRNPGPHGSQLVQPDGAKSLRLGALRLAISAVNNLGHE